MIVTGWNNGDTGYGIKIDMPDRKKFFRKERKSIVLELEGESLPIEVNTDKPSYWRPECGELISKEIRKWLTKNGLFTWPYREPPKLRLEPLSNCLFRLFKP
jgi:hypothetical protein